MLWLERGSLTISEDPERLKLSYKLVASTAVVLAVSGLAAAGPQVKFLDTDPWSGTSAGGPFELQAINFTPVGLGLHGAQANAFMSFCVEKNEYISNGKTFNVEFNTAAVGGGFGGGNPDPLDEETAFLYTMFMNGSLSTLVGDFSYLDGASGDAMQDAVWYFEQENSAPADGSLADKLVDLASGAVDSGSWSGIGNVRIMNLTKLGGGDAQDQLVMIPLPSAAGLALMGFGTIAIRRRR